MSDYDWDNRYAYPSRSGCLPVVIAVLLLAIFGCATVKKWEAKQLLNQYGCHYCQGESGFCCEKEVKPEHLWIMDCEYGL